MEKEKKKNSCSYAVLVVILFAALAFVVDYAVIERKMNKCNCPKCENTCPKCDVKEESSVVEESNAIENEDINVYPLNYFDAEFLPRYPDNDTKIEFKKDGTWNGKFNICEGYPEYYGTYTLDNDRIIVKLDDYFTRDSASKGETYLTIIDGDKEKPFIIEGNNLYLLNCGNGKYVLNSK